MTIEEPCVQILKRGSGANKGIFLKEPTTFHDFVLMNYAKFIYMDSISLTLFLSMQRKRISTHLHNASLLLASLVVWEAPVKHHCERGWVFPLVVALRLWLPIAHRKCQVESLTLLLLQRPYIMEWYVVNDVMSKTTPTPIRILKKISISISVRILWSTLLQIKSVPFSSINMNTSVSYPAVSFQLCSVKRPGLILSCHGS